jgi:hypothetical protein
MASSIHIKFIFHLVFIIFLYNFIDFLFQLLHFIIIVIHLSFSTFSFSCVMLIKIDFFLLRFEILVFHILLNFTKMQLAFSQN